MFAFESLLKNRFAVFALCFLPLVLYGWFFHAIALNVNYIAYDDIHVLQIIEQWQKAIDWRQKLDWLTLGFPEHRIVFTRFMVLLSYWATGLVNLKNLMIISNLLWISQLGVLYQVFKKLSLPFFYFIPLCWVLLCVHSFENIFWGTSSLGNFGLLFFVMMSGYFFTQSSPQNLYLALLFSLFATFTYGNGLLTFLIGSFMLVLTRRWRDLVITGGFFAFSMLLYALTRAHASPSGLDLTQPQNYWLALTCFFAFIGSSVNFDVYTPSTLAIWASVVWGALLLGSILWLLAQDIQLKNRLKFDLNSVQLFAFFLLCFVCLSALGVVFKRAEGDGLVGMFKGRYRMYPTWLLIIGYLLVLNWGKGLKSKSRWFSSLAIGSAMVFNLLILYYAIAPAVNNRRIAVAQEFNSMYNPDLLGLKMFDLTGKDFLRIQQLYQPFLFFKSSQKAIFPSIIATKNYPMDSVYFEGDILHIDSQKEFFRPSKNYDDGVYVLLQSLQHTYMSAGLQRALPIKTFLRRGWYWEKGFSATFNRPSVVKGKYKVYLLVRKTGINQLFDAQRNIIF